jgi:hypothetical protein
MKRATPAHPAAAEAAMEFSIAAEQERIAWQQREHKRPISKRGQEEEAPEAPLLHAWVGRHRLTVSKSVLKAPMGSALET